MPLDVPPYLSSFQLKILPMVQRQGPVWLYMEHTITLFWEKISIQFCDRIGIHINLENVTTTGVIWKAVHDTAVIHGTSIPLIYIIAKKVRSDASD